MKNLHIHRLVFSVPEKSMTFTSLLSCLRKRFAPYPWIKFKRKIHTDADAPGIIVSGEFDPEIGERGSCVVRLNFFTTGNNLDKIKFVGEKRYQILFQIFSTIIHERRHFLQSLKAKVCPPFPTVDPTMSVDESMQAYLSMKDEVDAHAYTAAIELAYHKDMVLESVQQYQRYFNNTHPTYKRFMKRTYKYFLTLTPL